MSLLFAVIMSHSKGSSVTVNSAAPVSSTGQQKPMRPGPLCLLLKYNQHQLGESGHGHLFPGVCPSRINFILQSRCNTNCNSYLLKSHISYSAGSKAWRCLKKIPGTKYQTNIKITTSSFNRNKQISVFLEAG